jgi:hypothetical protein
MYVHHRGLFAVSVLIRSSELVGVGFFSDINRILCPQRRFQISLKFLLL